MLRRDPHDILFAVSRRMSDKNKKRARRVVRRTAKVVKRLSNSVAPVLAGIAAGLAARDVAGPGSSYLEAVGKDLAKLVRTLSTRAASAVHTGAAATGNAHQPGEHAA